MQKVAEAALCILAMFLQSMTFGAHMAGQKVRYEGAGNVTAAAAISKDTFIVASADDNVLRIYKTKAPYAPVASFDVSGFLDVDPAIPITIAGASKVRGRIYWITSHSRDESGKFRPERYHFFATTIAEKNGDVTVEPVGKPCRTLMHKLVNLRTVSTLGLAKATRFGQREQERLAPNDQGLSIGALCASHNSNMLYIAFFNPRPIRVITGTPHALIVPLDNAAEVIDKGKNPIFGEGMLWDLRGLGIVGFEYSPAHKEYFVVAVSHDARKSFNLYRWSGMKAYSPVRLALPAGYDKGFVASSVICFEDRSKILLPDKETEGAFVEGNIDSMIDK
jgi:hypothetical protein